MGFFALFAANLTSPVTIFPPPVNYEKVRDFECVKREISAELAICGFMDMNDVGSPCAYTRHLVLPVCNVNGKYVYNSLRRIINHSTNLPAGTWISHLSQK